MNPLVLAKIREKNTSSQSLGIHRSRRVMPDSIALSFSSNDYLSLGREPQIQQAYQRGYSQFPVCSSGSPVISGYHEAHRQLEQAFARALEVDDCLFFSSGYLANLGLMSLLSALDLKIYIDKGIHASIYDGIKLAGVNVSRYLHCNPLDLKAKSLNTNQPSIIVTESLFSMSGQIAPLSDLVNCGIDVVVDEAHAFGVMGQEGLGFVRELKRSQDMVPLRVIPLGKAFAGSGAIIAGQGEWIDALLQSARSYIYSTALSPAQAHGLLFTLDFLRQADERRLKLNQLVDYFRQSIQGSHWTWQNSTSAIQRLHVGCPFRAQALAEQLLNQGIFCLPIRQPTVSKPETGLRISLNYHHQSEDIDRLLSCLKRL